MRRQSRHVGGACHAGHVQQSAGVNRMGYAMDEIKREFEVVVPDGLSEAEEAALIEAETERQLDKLLGDFGPF